MLAGVLIYRYSAWSWLHARGASDTSISHVLALTPGLLDSFASGGLLALLGAPRPNPIRSRCLVVLALVLFILIHAIFVENANRYWTAMPMAVCFRSLVALLATIALLAALTSAPGKSRFWRPLLWLGKASYGIYLWHLIVLYGVQAHLPLRGTAAVVLIVTLTLLLAEFSRRAIEQQFMRWARAEQRKQLVCRIRSGSA